MPNVLMITEWPRRKRKPSSTDEVDATRLPATGGAGAIPANTASASAYVTASTLYALVRPNTPISTPASAGPAIIPNDAYVAWSAYAAGRSSVSTSIGSRERNTGKATATVPLVTAPST
jgi:hypothetical protein